MKWQLSNGKCKCKRTCSESLHLTFNICHLPFDILLCLLVVGCVPKTTHRQMYLGPTKLSSLPVIVLADTAIPSAFRTEVQCSRRIVGVDLGAGATAADLLPVPSPVPASMPTVALAAKS